MFRINLLQDQYLILALVGGLVLLGLVVLTYMAFWRPRERVIDEDAAAAPDRPPRGAWLRSFMPWILIATFAATLVWMIAYLLMTLGPTAELVMDDAAA